MRNFLVIIFVIFFGCNTNNVNVIVNGLEHYNINHISKEKYEFSNNIYLSTTIINNTSTTVFIGKNNKIYTKMDTLKLTIYSKIKDTLIKPNQSTKILFEFSITPSLSELGYIDYVRVKESLAGAILNLSIRNTENKISNIKVQMPNEVISTYFVNEKKQDL